MTGLEDLSLLAEASNCCFAGLWGHMENNQMATVAIFEDLVHRRPGYIISEGAFLFFAPDGSIAGLCPIHLGPEDPQAPGVRMKILDAPGALSVRREPVENISAFLSYRGFRPKESQMFSVVVTCRVGGLLPEGLAL